jgi:hypothetical protein
MNKQKTAIWLFQYDCGKTKEIKGTSVTHGQTVSCGCFCAEIHRTVVPQKNRKHGKVRSPEYHAYQNARKRCLDPEDRDYRYYGARGILFRFTSFKQFYDEIGDRPTAEHQLDRRNANGDYTRQCSMEHQKPTNAQLQQTKKQDERISRGLVEQEFKKMGCGHCAGRPS